jgi:hypothetical protein
LRRSIGVQSAEEVTTVYGQRTEDDIRDQRTEDDKEARELRRTGRAES